MTFWLSEPIETKLRSRKKGERAEVDYLIVGSGYGAVMAALAIGEANKENKSIWVLEKGDEYVPDDFPKTIDDLPGHLNYFDGENAGSRRNAIKNDLGLFEIRNGEGMSILSGSGLGGTSLINANVAAEPDQASLRALERSSGCRLWTNEVPQAYVKIKNLLGADPLHLGEKLPKFAALDDTIRGINAACGAKPESPQLADLTINKKDNVGGETYPHSAWHGACNNCGNCVIGCHSGAKQSLNMNAWPLAKQFGVKMYTGANVRELERCEDSDIGDWIVKGYSSRNKKTQFNIRARHVILAAGTIGSVEILRRSRKTGDLKFSLQLGKKFSANGDTLFSSVGESKRVSAVAGKPQDTTNNGNLFNPPGPTIVGKGSVELPFPASTTYRRTVTLEDGAIPYPLIHLWQELITTQSFLHRYESNRLSDWHVKHKDHDYLAISSDLANHSQVLLVMGDDNAAGELLTRHEITEKTYDVSRKLDSDCDDNEAPDDSIILPYWPSGSGRIDANKQTSADYYQHLHATLRQYNKSDYKTVFNGGQYHPNPIWKMLPDEFSLAVEGADTLEDKLVSVHPLGGCSMGKNAGCGVVNNLGQVYTGTDKDSVYNNLYVLDGSIIPGAIGTNPFLTIASAAYILAKKIVDNDIPLDELFPSLDKDKFGPDWLKIPAGNRSSIPDDEKQKVSANFKERFVYHIDRDNKAGLPWSPKSGPTLAEFQKILGAGFKLPASTASLILDTEIVLQDQKTLDQWLEHPEWPLKATASLKADVFGSVLTISDAHCIDIAKLEGSITLGKLFPTNGIRERFCRKVRALRKYRDYRPYDESWLKKLFKERLNENGCIDRLKRPFLNLMGLFRTAGLHADWRQMHYHFSPDGNSDLDPKLNLHFSGTKTIAYATGQKDLLASLMTINTVVRSDDTGESLAVPWEMDLVRTTKGPAPLQLMNQLNLLHALSKVGGALTFFARVLMQTNFWSFGAHDYQKYQTLEEMNDTPVTGRLEPPPMTMPYGSGRVSKPKEEWHWDADSLTWVGKGATEDRLCRLIRYQPADPDQNRERKSLLLIHGLAHSSRVFWAHTIDENFVQYFLDKNYDVWIMDHRTSANYVEDVNPDHTWDQIALQDVAHAVDFVYRTINENNPDFPAVKRKVHVFSHCIGAGATCIALLDGKLSVDWKPGHNEGTADSAESKVASLVPHAVTPWLYTSVENRARGNIWQMFKEFDLFKVVDPYPHKKTEFREIIMDRLATATLNEEEDAQWKVEECGEYKTDEKIEISWWEKYKLRREDRKDKRGPGFPRAIYLRYTIIWGRQWFKKNVNRKTRKDFASMIGPTPIDVMQQVYFSISRGMLSNHEGNNKYVRHANITRNWKMPTLFLHGNKNTVFDMESSKTSAYMLTQHRRLENGDTQKNELLPEDYCDKNIWIDIIPDYGHMDIIFGTSANEKVYPKLDKFFSAAESIARGNSSAYFSEKIEEYRKPEKLELFQKYCSTKSHGSPIKRPRTGPIISLPKPALGENGETRDGEITVRIWCETQDFTSMPANVMYIQEGDGTGAVRHKPEESFRADSVGLLLDGDELLPELKDIAVKDEFWLRDYTTDPCFGDTRYLWITNEPDDPDNSADPGESDAQESVPKTHIKLDWHKLDWLRRISGSVDCERLSTRLSFLIGSCFYPGTTFDNEQSFNVFEGMYRHVDPPPGSSYQGVDHVLLLGDQIYADATANLFDARTGYEKYRDRYREAWSSKSYPFQSPVRKLFSHVPTYFAIDDHEYEDNFQGFESPTEDKTQFDYAKQMAWLYQIHQYDWTRTTLRLHQSFESAGFPFFVFDTRMQRSQDPDGTRNNSDTLLGVGGQQLRFFNAWLSKAQEKSDVLFIASGSPLIPLNKNVYKESDLLQGGDTLASYPGFLGEVIDSLFNLARGKYVVWLSGDPHLSCYAELDLEQTDSDGNTRQVKFFHVCSSGLYEPLSFINVNCNSIAWGTALDVGVPNSDIRLKSKGQHFLADSAQHFVRIDIGKNDGGHNPTLSLTACGADGEVIKRVSDLELGQVV